MNTDRSSRPRMKLKHQHQQLLAKSTRWMHIGAYCWRPLANEIKLRHQRALTECNAKVVTRYYLEWCGFANGTLEKNQQQQQQMVREVWRKATSHSCHPSWRRMDSSDLDLSNTWFLASTRVRPQTASQSV